MSTCLSGEPRGLRLVWGRRRESGRACENVVPVVFGRAETADGRVERGHLLGDGIQGSSRKSLLGKDSSSGEIKGLDINTQARATGNEP